jgi:hypothetical protein
VKQNRLIIIKGAVCYIIDEALNITVAAFMKPLNEDLWNYYTYIEDRRMPTKSILNKMLSWYKKNFRPLGIMGHIMGRHVTGSTEFTENLHVEGEEMNLYFKVPIENFAVEKLKSGKWVEYAVGILTKQMLPKELLQETSPPFKEIVEIDGVRCLFPVGQWLMIHTIEHPEIGPTIHELFTFALPNFIFDFDRETGRTKAQKIEKLRRSIVDPSILSGWLGLEIVDAEMKRGDLKINTFDDKEPVYPDLKFYDPIPKEVLVRLGCWFEEDEDTSVIDKPQFDPLINLNHPRLEQIDLGLINVEQPKIVGKSGATNVVAIEISKVPRKGIKRSAQDKMGSGTFNPKIMRIDEEENMIGVELKLFDVEEL